MTFFVVLVCAPYFIVLRSSTYMSTLVGSEGRTCEGVYYYLWTVASRNNVASLVASSKGLVAAPLVPEIVQEIGLTTAERAQKI